MQKNIFDTQRKNFALFMKTRNLTAYDWAKRSGITEGTIRSYLSGRSASLTYSTLFKLAQAEHVSPKDIIEINANTKSMIQLKNSFNLYLKRDTLDYCIEIVDNVLQQKKCRITSKNRRNIYYSLHDIKIEKHDNDNILSIDKNRIEILLKIISYN